MENRNPLLGKWQLDGLYTYEDAEFHCLSKYEQGTVVWHFTDSTTLRIYSNGELEVETSYDYKERKLTVDNSYNEIVAHMIASGLECPEEYRVHRVDDKTIWLYDLEEVITEPDDYYLAYRLSLSV